MNNFDRVIDVERWAFCIFCGAESRMDLTADGVRSWAVAHVAVKGAEHDVHVINTTTRLYNTKSLSAEQMRRELIRRGKVSA